MRYCVLRTNDGKFFKNGFGNPKNLFVDDICNADLLPMFTMQTALKIISNIKGKMDIDLHVFKVNITGIELVGEMSEEELLSYKLKID